MDGRDRGIRMTPRLLVTGGRAITREDAGRSRCPYCNGSPWAWTDGVLYSFECAAWSCPGPFISSGLKRSSRAAARAWNRAVADARLTVPAGNVVDLANQQQSEVG